MTDNYDAIADEYYSGVHKTSRNFDRCSQIAFAAQKIRDLVPQHGLVLDVGAGSGRAQEYLAVQSNRVIQLDSSSKMLSIELREPSLLRVHHRAEDLPFLDGEFACVTAFLCDGFIGLEFLRHAYRVLKADGVLVGTVPTRQWGVPLRNALKLDVDSTRFVCRTGAVVVLPSTLVTDEELSKMLRRVGFSKNNFEIAAHALPSGTEPVSDDIFLPAQKLGLPFHELPILYSFVAVK